MRILFTAYPSPSQIEAMLPLMAAAKQAGHAVALASGPDVVHHAERVGATGIGCGLSEAEIVRRYLDRFPERSGDSSLQASVAIAAPAMAEALVPLVRDAAPQLIVAAETEFGAEIAADAARTALVRHAVTAPLPSDAYVRNLMDELRARWGLGDRTATVRQPYLDRWPAGLRREPDRLDRWPLRPDALLPPHIPGQQPDLLAALPYEATLFVAADTAWAAQPGALPGLLAAVGPDAAVNVVVAVAPEVDPAGFGPMPAQIRFVQQVPATRLMPYCAAAICPAGSDAALTALAHGVPVVMTRLPDEQESVGDAVVAAGAGIACDGDDATGLRSACRSVLSAPSYRERARGVAADIAAMPGPAEVMSNLERHVREVAAQSSRRPVRPYRSDALSAIRNALR